MESFAKNKVTIITGGTNGLGKATAFELARQGALVTIIGRTPQKCAQVADQIKAASGNPVEWIAVDLSTPAGVQSAVSQFNERNDHLHILINNAGALFRNLQYTEDGYEMTFALNHLSYFSFTNLLLDKLVSSHPARIINVSSLAHASINKLDLENMQNGRRYNGMIAYSQSKLCNLLFTYELARILKDTGVTVNAVHPGYVNTGFAKNNGPIYRFFIEVGGRLFAKKPLQGAQTMTYLATSNIVDGITGKYFSDFKETTSSKLSYDRTVASGLWQKSLELTGMTH